MNWKQTTLTGWGRTTKASVAVCRPERLAELRGALAAVDGGGIIVHAGGRSYGDAALNNGGRAILSERLDRLLGFDDATGMVIAEPGVTFADLLRLFLPRGYLAPVTPGTAFATLGGALANDVHGKNHDRAGSFADHVAWFDLMLPSGDIVRASPQERADLFAATVGGVGMTGVVTAIALRMVRVPSPAVVVRERRLADLEAFIAELERLRPTATYSVGWVDALARGRSLGRGIIETAEPAPDATAVLPPSRRHRIPVDLPGFALNRLSVRLFNDFYRRRIPPGGRERTVHYSQFLYPLDAIRDWNRIYGRRGFHQFQCVLPDESSAAGLRALLETIAASGAASFLAVLKTLGGPGSGYLSFPLRGYTLALDFPNGRGTAALFARLERLTLDHGGRIYLAKDSRLSAQGFAAMYPQLPAFRTVIERIDPTRRMASDLARRLGIRGAAA